MAVGQSRGSADASRPREADEPVYEGAAGRARLRSIHVPEPDGFVRAVQVYDVVDVGAHPELREPALSGALHRLENGETLALPFVFHDPAARKLALVVPEALRHDALRLRAELMAEMARDAAHPVPSYAREATTVVGLEALARYLEASGADPRAAAALAEREAELEAEQATLAQREARLVTRAEEVTRREDELRALAAQLEAKQADLGRREQELEARMQALHQQEAQLAQRTEALDALDLLDDVEEVSDLEPIGTSPSDGDAVELVDPLADDQVQLVDDAQLIEDGPLSDAQLIDEPLGDDDAQLVDDAQLIDEDDASLSGDDAQLLEHAQLLDDEEPIPLGATLASDVDDDVEELDEIEPLGDVTGIHAGLLQEEDTGVRSPREAKPRGAPIALPASELPPPSVAPPPEFVEGALGASMSAILEDGAVRLFARLPDGKDALFQEAPDLLAQLVSVEERPVVLLALVDSSEARPVVLRAALDPRAQGDRAILEALRGRFAARVSVFAADDRYLRSLDVRAPREVNVARILERVSRTRTAAAVDAQTAMERALATPPPVSAKDHPFTEAGDEATSAAKAAEALDQLAEWSSHDKLDHALLVLSIPRDRVDLAVRRVLRAAVDHGLALPEGLPDRAISLGVAPDRARLVGRIIEAFSATSTQGGGGLSPERIAENWERLLTMAAENEVAIDAATHDIAWRRIHDVRGGGEGPEIDAAKLPEMGAPELVLLLEHPRHRKDAALELCRRKDPALADTLSKSIRKMPRAEVVRVVPRLVDLGEEAGDAIIDGLGARKTFVRQAFALALGVLKLRRAVVPLVHLLAAEESEVWREVARVVGSFGSSSLRNVTRQLRDPKGKDARYALTLAHLANNGCAKQVERLTQDSNLRTAGIARQAMDLRDQARAIEDQVRGEGLLSGPISGDDAVLAFSRRFYQELEGQAPSGDLEDGPGTGT